MRRHSTVLGDRFRKFVLLLHDFVPPGPSPFFLPLVLSLEESMAVPDTGYTI